MSESTATHVHPRLVVRDPDRACRFYASVFGAELVERFTDGEGRVVHAALRIGVSVISIAAEVAAWGLHSPESLGGSPMLAHLTLPDPDEAAARGVAQGGVVLVAIADRPYGKREGRFRDPFGHLWVLSRPIEDLEPSEIRRRMGSPSE